MASGAMRGALHARAIAKRRRAPATRRQRNASTASRSRVERLAEALIGVGRGAHTRGDRAGAFAGSSSSGRSRRETPSDMETSTLEPKQGRIG